MFLCIYYKVTKSSFSLRDTCTIYGTPRNRAVTIFQALPIIWEKIALNKSVFSFQLATNCDIRNYQKIIFLPKIKIPSIFLNDTAYFWLHTLVVDVETSSTTYYTMALKWLWILDCRLIKGNVIAKNYFVSIKLQMPICEREKC